jgi:hypothetical protein
VANLRVKKEAITISFLVSFPGRQRCKRTMSLEIVGKQVANHCLQFSFYISSTRPPVKTKCSHCHHPRTENEGMWAFGTMFPALLSILSLGGLSKQTSLLVGHEIPT